MRSSAGAGKLLPAAGALLLLLLCGGAALFAGSPEKKEAPRFRLRGSQIVQRGDVAYNHERHQDRSGNCRDCHPRTFKMKRGRTPITMRAIDSGQVCGRCHNGRAAFASKGNCTRCHSRIGRQNIYFRGVTFRHSTHGARYRCDACHPKIFTMKRGATPFRMADIYAGRACGRCHNGGRAFSSVWCMSCHTNPASIMGRTVRYRSATLGDVRFSHRNHVVKKRITCAACHPRPFRMAAGRTGFTMDSISRGYVCGRCHNGRRAFSVQSCSSCHSKVGPNGGFGRKGIVTRRTEKAGVITFSHETHIRGRSCSSCHGKGPASFRMKAGETTIAMSDIYAGSSCGACHNGIKAFGTGDCLRCHEGLKPPADITWKSESTPSVTFSHANHAAMGAKCADCHFGTFKPRKGASRITMSLINAGRQCGKCHDGKSAFASSDCMQCHGEDLIPKDIVMPEESVGPVSYSHKAHMAKGLTCADCHPGLFRMKTGADTITMDAINGGKLCGACHDGVKTFAADDCARCHKMPE